MSDLFLHLDIETASLCLRRCPTCLRNSHPDRSAVASWFEPNYLPLSVIEQIFQQAVEIGFNGSVCLSHFNEPLLDERIAEIAQIARIGAFQCVYLVTNGDYLNPELASRLDGVLHKIVVSLYMDEPIKSKRAEWIRSLFKKTQVEIILHSQHLVTHFSPLPSRREMIEEYRFHSCVDLYHLIINHRQQYLLCCEDLIGNFDLGTFPETGLEDYWFGAHHQTLISTLANPDGRLGQPYCAICPKS